MDEYTKAFIKAWPAIRAISSAVDRHVWNLGYVPTRVTLQDLLTGEDSSPKDEN